MLLQVIGTLEDLIDQYKINVIQLIFITFIITIVLLGSLMTLLESHLPNCLRQSFRYGKHAHKGATDAIVSHLEVPKAWFSHFYIFALAWSMLALYLISSAVWHQNGASEYVLRFLDLMCGGRSQRQVLVDSNTALLGSALLGVQCLRRFYETNFVQIFSRRSKINLSHYAVGYMHYFGAIISLLGNTAGFVRGTEPTQFTLQNVTPIQGLYTVIFLFACWQQYASNLLLVRLRQHPKTGDVQTEAHLMPSGGWFDYISSPHMFFEVVMYFCLADLFTPIITWKLIFLWVASNQTINALLTHQWYKDSFKDYPKRRHAIIPWLL
ncbi:polyprenol reductase [Drosophila grimshawi]|uniref:Polyprenal reductase n=1 Tax=Drosophila grimshawi TaxID=7222 RepID=B4JBV9_DROGR|nr:polyprenol reductase [Drosophila grimshawi]EDW04062.1 GH11587 [Drosophila grimshawi]